MAAHSGCQEDGTGAPGNPTFPDKPQPMMGSDGEVFIFLSKGITWCIDLGRQHKLEDVDAYTKVGAVTRPELEKLWRQDFTRRAGQFYRLFHAPAKFNPGGNWVSCSDKVFSSREMEYLIDASLDFLLTTGRYAADLEEQITAFLGVPYCLLTNSGSLANLLAVSALTSPKLGERQLKPGD